MTERNDSSNQQYIYDSLYAWLDCRDLISNEYWLDRIQNIEFKLTNFSASDISYDGANFSRYNNDIWKNIMSEIDNDNFKNGFSVELLFDDFSYTTSNICRILTTSSKNISNAPSLNYFKGKFGGYGFGADSWGDFYKFSGNVENFPQTFTLTMSINSNGNVKIYKNGEILVDGYVQAPTSCNAICINFWSNELVYSYGETMNDGILKSLRFYNRVISDEEIRHNYSVDKEIFNL